MCYAFQFYIKRNLDCEKRMKMRKWLEEYIKKKPSLTILAALR